MIHEYWEILSNPAHILVEFTFVLFDYLIIQLVVRRVNRLRDKRHGHKD